MSYLIQYEPDYRAMFREQENARLHEHKKNLERQVANLKKKLWRAESPGWHESKRWSEPNYTHSRYSNQFVLSHKWYTGDNEWRYVVILRSGVRPITYYRQLRRDSTALYAMLKSGWEDLGFFTPFTAKARKSRRQGREVWIITWDIRRDC